MSKDAGKTVLALFAGIAAGVALGVLLAPEKGEDTRHKISDATNKITNDLREKVLCQPKMSASSCWFLPIAFRIRN